MAHKKRKDGRYGSKVFIGRDELGRPRYKHIYARSESELRDKEAEVRRQLGLGLDVLSRRDSFEQWAEDWIRIKATERLTEKHMDNLRFSARFWADQLSGYEIGQVRPDDIERVLLALADAGYSQRTIDLHRSVIRQIMRRAVGRVIPSNPVDQVTIKVRGRLQEQRRALTKDEQQWIFDTPHRGQPVAVIMMLSGLRRGELAALTWNDVDLDARTITVNKTIVYNSNGVPTLRHWTKTDAGMRQVHISQLLADYMRGMPKDNALVIHNARGGVMTPSAWTKLWKSYMRVLNEKYGERTTADMKRRESGKPGPKALDMTIPPITLHWLRHTFCSLLYQAGVDVMTARDQMGHANIKTTLDIYTHMDREYQRDSMSKLDDYHAAAGITIKQN